MLSLKNISMKAGQKDLFKSSDIILQKGLYALVGRNGSGKSTFLRSILGEHDNYTGEILLNNLPTKEITTSDMAGLAAVVYTRVDVFGNHTVEEVLALGRIPKQGMLGIKTSEDHDAILKVIDQLKLNQIRYSRFNDLSDGEKQLAMIGRALVQDTAVLILDEPAAYLDLVNRVKLIETLKEIAAQDDKLILFSTHHIDILDVNCDGMLLINDHEMNLLQNDLEAAVKNAFGL